MTTDQYLEQARKLLMHLGLSYTQAEMVVSGLRIDAVKVLVNNATMHLL